MLCNIPCRIVLFLINAVGIILAIVLGVVGGLMAWGEKAIEVIIKKVLLPLITTFAENEDPQAISDLVHRLATTTAPIGYALFAAGCVLFAITVVGFVGACINSQIALIVVYKVAEDVLKNSITAYMNMEVNNMDSLIIGFVMPTLKCCGLKNSSEFINMLNTETYQRVVYTDIEHPISCCKMDDKFRLLDTTCPKEFNEQNSNVNVPCDSEFRAKFFKYADYFAYGLIGCAGFLAALIAFTAMTMCVDCI
ncbi:hypothetical protein PHET_06676 [Paragonimus heterotremus]|uniref:Tetraspanin n=1 Tax=Paragonimus heterotremus TaxID=100268 RepID=A0A8J4T8Q0_9TREM|nr:hypothetical protein PHET_06676 [Paragonimus heterotremus]